MGRHILKTSFSFPMFNCSWSTYPSRQRFLQSCLAWLYFFLFLNIKNSSISMEFLLARRTSANTPQTKWGTYCAFVSTIFTCLTSFQWQFLGDSGGNCQNLLIKTNKVVILNDLEGVNLSLFQVFYKFLFFTQDFWSA